MTEGSDVVDVKEEPLPLWRRVLSMLIIAGLVLMVGSMAASYLLRWQLGREISKAAGIGEPMSFSEMAKDSGEVAADKDAMGLYMEAILATFPDDQGNLLNANSHYLAKLDSVPAGEITKETHREVSQQMIKFQSILARFDKAAGMPLSGFDMDIEYGMEACQKRLAHIRAASLLMSLRVLELTSRDQDEAAAYSAMSMMRVLRVFKSYPTMTISISKAGLVGLACDDIRLLLEHGDLSDGTLQKLQAVLNDTIRGNSLERSFLAERIYQMALARDLLSKKMAVKYLQDDFIDMPERILIPESSLERLKLQVNTILFFRQMAKFISAAGDPWPVPLDSLEKLSEKPSKLIKAGTVFAGLAADISAILESTVTVVAIERYRKAKGEVPDSLNELVPDYIGAVGIDPYTGKQLRYVHDDTGYTVYGIGENRIDDGGKTKSLAKGVKPLDLGVNIRFRE